MTWLNWDVTEHHWKHQWTDLELINTQQKKEWEYPESNTLTWIWNATKQREGRNNQEKKKEKFFQNSMLCPIRWHSCIESEHSKRMKDRDVWTNQDVARLFYCQATLLWGQTLKVPHKLFACATTCFTPRDCDSAAATYCMDLIKGSFVNATILNKVLSFRTIVSIYLAWRATTTTLLCLFMEIPTKRRLSYCLGMGRWIYMYFLFQKVADKWLA